MNRPAASSVVVCLLLVGLAWSMPAPQSTSTLRPPPELQALRVAPEGTMAGYSRDRFPHWAHQGNACDTRETVLQRQGVNVYADNKCRATGGAWTSPYDGIVMTKAADVDLDHVVPLAESWRSGASSWTDQRRAALANDLGGAELVTSSRMSNRAKGDRDPARWKPPARTYWCTYARNWIRVKAAYQLTADPAEHHALAVMLTTC